MKKPSVISEAAKKSLPQNDLTDFSVSILPQSPSGVKMAVFFRNFKSEKAFPEPSNELFIMKKMFIISCLILGIFTEGSSFAATKKCPSRYYRSYQTIEAPAVSEEKCIADINRVRQEHGLQPLKGWTQLSACAREHSQNMAAGKCPFGHDGFKQRADQMQTQATLSSFAENVAYSHKYDDPVQIAVDGWMKSPGHKKNILGDFEETGVGVAVDKEGKFYITQLFAKRYNSRSSSYPR